MRIEGWNDEWISRDDLIDQNNLNNKLIKSRKNIIIADYGQSFAREIGIWMTKLARDVASGKNTSRNRILIINRDQYDNDTVFSSRLTANDHNGRLKGHIYKDEFLRLRTLQNNNIKEILKNYVNYRGKNLNDKMAGNMLKTLERIDPGLRRPLYAIFIADAYCDDVDSTHWNKEKILDWVTDREDKLIINCIEQHVGELNNKQKKAIEAIRFIATICDNIRLNAIKEKYCEKWKKYNKTFEHTLLDFEECLEISGIIEDDLLKAIRPDLIGEYYVLKKYGECRELLFSNGWTENEDIMAFIDRFISDYQEEKLIIKDFYLYGLKHPAITNQSDYYGVYESLVS